MRLSRSILPSVCLHLSVQCLTNASTYRAVKAYIRKASVLQSMREYAKALEALQAATEADTTHAHTSEIQAQEFKIQQALFTQRADETDEQTLERAMRDPEVAVRTFSTLLDLQLITFPRKS